MGINRARLRSHHWKAVRLETLEDRCVGERDDLIFRQRIFWDRHKGDRNACEEISADDVGDAFSGRMPDFLRCMRSNRARARRAARQPTRTIDNALHSVDDARIGGRVYPISADYRAGMNSPFRKYMPAHCR
jgi:hypothetical protein